MGRKRKRTVTNDEPAELELEDLEINIESLSKKRSKKEKHKKKKAKRDSVESQEGDEDPKQAPLTLKIRFGNELVTTSDPAPPPAAGSDIVSILADDDSINTTEMSSNKSTGSLIKHNSEEWGGSDDVVSVGDEESSFMTTIPDQNEDEETPLGIQDQSLDDDGTLLEEGLEEDGLDETQEDDEEEEVWLEALVSGNVDERGYLPQKKDPTAMTARQRAMFKSEEVELLELPLMKKRGNLDDEETQEMLLKKTERNKKRRLQAIKRREKHKAETVQKLLQKQTRKKEDKKIEKTVVGPHLRYINSASGITVSLTEGLEYPLESTHAQPKRVSPPRVVSCSMCPSPKRYNDSVTKQPLCSLECYKKLKNSNLQHQSHHVTVSPC